MNKFILVIFLSIVTTCTATIGSGAVCRDGESYRSECVDCKCQQGAFVCEDAKCNHKREAIALGVSSFARRLKRGTLTDDLKSTPCALNDYFKIDCNVCYCNTEGTGYLCTENIGCGKEIESTTSKIQHLSDNIPIAVDNNSNDNTISRIAKSGGSGDEKLHQMTSIHELKDVNERASNVPLDRISPKDVTPAPVLQTEKTPSAP